MHYDMAVCYGMFRGWVNSSTNTKPSSYMYMHIGLLVLGCNVLGFLCSLEGKGSFIHCFVESVHRQTVWWPQQ